jgi:hypothetical protein
MVVTPENLICADFQNIKTIPYILSPSLPDSAIYIISNIEKKIDSKIIQKYSGFDYAILNLSLDDFLIPPFHELDMMNEIIYRYWIAGWDVIMEISDDILFGIELIPMPQDMPFIPGNIIESIYDDENLFSIERINILIKNIEEENPDLIEILKNTYFKKCDNVLELYELKSMVYIIYESIARSLDLLGYKIPEISIKTMSFIGKEALRNNPELPANYLFEEIQRDSVNLDDLYFFKESVFNYSSGAESLESKFNFESCASFIYLAMKREIRTQWLEKKFKILN